jgi:hypothetical protein
MNCRPHLGGKSNEPIPLAVLNIFAEKSSKANQLINSLCRETTKKKDKLKEKSSS